MWVIYAGALWLVAVASHALIRRVHTRSGVVTSFLVVGGLAGAYLIWLLVAQYGPWAPQTLAAVLWFSLLCELYIFFSTLALYSISATLLRLLRRRGHTAEALVHLYDNTSMVSGRIERLLAARLLAASDRGLQLTVTGRRLARTFLALTDFFGHLAAPTARPRG